MQQQTSGGKYAESLLIVGGILIIASLSADAQRSEAHGQATTAQSKVTHNLLVQHEIGQRFQIDPTDLPAPKTGPIATNRPLIVPYNGQVPQVPPGFTATPLRPA